MKNPAKIGDKVAAPVLLTNPGRGPVRCRYSYDIGVVIATGKNKKSGKRAVKVKFVTADTIWVKKLTTEPMYQKWFLLSDVDKV